MASKASPQLEQLTDKTSHSLHTSVDENVSLDSDVYRKMTQPITQEKRDEILNEKGRVAKLSRIRQFVFGSLDGLSV